MKLPVLVEANPSGDYTVRLGSPFNLNFNGSTVAEATAKLESALTDEAAKGRMVYINMPVLPKLSADVEDPIAHLLDHPDALPDDALTQKWMQAIQDNRKKRDLDDERLGREW